MGSSTAVKVTVDGKEVDPSDLLAFTCERDLGQPDMAAIVLSNQAAHWSSQVEVMKQIEVKAGDSDKLVYKGEVVGVEANYKGGEKARLTVRAMNKMHRLLRQKKSVTFVDKTDQQIITDVATKAGLTVAWEHTASVQYKHVYQHNQTDLEFIRMRAARIGAHIWCKDTELSVKEPKLDQSPLSKLHMGKSSEKGNGVITEFRPRLSSAAIVKKVTVKGWNPETKELIVGDYTVPGAKLGKETAVAGSKTLAAEETFVVDLPLWTVDEAKAVAKARLVDLSLSYITGECEVSGMPRDYEPDLGKVIEIIATEEDASANDPFNGKYYITGLTFRYLQSKNKDGGFSMVMRLARDAQKGG